MPPSSKTSVTNFIRDAIKAGQIIQDRHIIINTQSQIPVVIIHQFPPVNNYVAIQIR
jgi:hypothetical protein